MACMLSVSERITEKEAKLKPWLSFPAEVMKILTLSIVPQIF